MHFVLFFQLQMVFEAIFEYRLPIVTFDGKINCEKYYVDFEGSLRHFFEKEEKANLFIYSDN